MENKIWLAGIVVVAAAVGSLMAYDYLTPGEEYVPYHEELPYQESDITKADKRFKISHSTTSWKTTDISKIRHGILATFRGEVTDIGDPIEWNSNVGTKHGAIPITIKIIENTKNSELKERQPGDQFTFYIDSIKTDGKYYIWDHEPEFDVGEEVIVHVAKSPLGPMGAGGDNYYVELGDFGKYKIIDNKAYNKKYPEGRSVADSLSESK